MAKSQINFGELGGGGSLLNPTLADHDTKTRTGTTMTTFTIDTSKRYILVLTYRYASDTTYRTNTYYVANNTLTDLSNNSTTTGLTPTLSGTSLFISGSDVSTVPCDMSLIQLD